MTNDTRIAAAQEFFQRSFHGEVSSAIELLDENVSYHVPGTHQLSGDFEGPEAVAEHLGKLLQLTSRTVNVLQWEDWMLGVNHVAALTHMSVQHRGAVHSFRAVYVVTIAEDAKIRRIEIFFADQAAVERFFSAMVE
ncbi:MAG: nuclear transport factor 2 family protein [Acidimicrobiales bacterium]